MKKYTILVVSPTYMIALGYPSQVRVMVKARTEEEAHEKARIKVERMVKLIAA